MAFPPRFLAMATRRRFVAGAGAAALSTSPARAQQIGTSHRIGYLALLPGEDATLAKPFWQRLKELGYSAGTNLVIEYRSADNRPERLAELAADIMRTRPDVLVAGFGTLTAKVAAAATTTTPVVFTSVGDPVAAGLVASLARPGANVTGLSARGGEFVAKQVQILEELVPGKRTIAVLANPDTPYSAAALREIKSAAEQDHLPLEVFEARTADQVSAGIETAISRGAAGLIVLDDPLMLSIRGRIVALAADARLPTIHGFREFAEAGGLISFGPDQKQIYRRAAEYVDKVLKGALPASLPVEQPTTFNLLINLKTAKALGLTLSPSLLAQADEVIE